MKVFVNSEVGELCEVLVGSAGSFSLHQPINSAQQYYYEVDPPKPRLLLEQQATFIKTLERFGVRILEVESRSDSPLQFFTRDVATVVSDQLIVCSMKESLRRNEIQALEHLLERVKSPVIQVHAGVVEGGDIILDGDTMYAGLSERTNPSGLKWLKEQFGSEFEIVAVELQPSFLHLDVVFNLIGNAMALVFPPALHHSSIEYLEKRYRLVEISKNEQFNLAANMLSLSPETVISDRRHARVNAVLRDLGLEVIELDYSEVTKTGGAFRCATCPLVRNAS